MHQVSYLLLRYPQPVSAAVGPATYSAGIKKEYVRITLQATDPVFQLTAFTHTGIIYEQQC